MPTPVITTSNQSWTFQQNNIERLMDHAALTSAHPDDTLILAGPARWGVTGAASATEPHDQLLPIGMVQSFNAMLQKPTQPMQAIGSGRTFFVSGKAQGNAQIARLFVNGRNLLRVLYTNAVQAGIDISKFDDRAAIAKPTSAPDTQFFMNLDSELFLIPFGLACFFRDKIHSKLGAFYLELCALNSYNISFNAGQNMILENVAMMFDRAIPMNMGSWGEAVDNYPTGTSESNILNQKTLGTSLTFATAYPGLADK